MIAKPTTVTYEFTLDLAQVENLFEELRNAQLWYAGEATLTDNPAQAEWYRKRAAYIGTLIDTIAAGRKETQ